MKLSRPVLLLVLFIIVGMIGTKSFAEPSPTEVLMKATTLTCTFTSEQQTRWGSNGPVKEEGAIQDKVAFLSINHQAGESKIRGGQSMITKKISPCEFELLPVVSHFLS